MSIVLGKIPAPVRVVASVLGDLAREVAALHEAGTLHGAIAPDRIRIGEDGRCTIAQEGSITAARRHGAPEREHGLVPASDVWSIGALAHALLVGEPPSGSTTPALSELTDDVPESLDVAVAHALRLDPAERPSARAIVDALEELIGDSASARVEVLAWCKARVEREGEGEPARARRSSGEVVSGSLIDGKYRIDAVLGRGGAGIVYAATHLGMQRAVAIKVLVRHAAREPRLVRRFVREARIASVLDHPSAVRVHDLGNDGRAYLVMERLEGETLRARLDRGPLGHAEALSIAASVIGALAHAHRRGVVHRDVKPENVFLATKPRACAVLLDFGISKLGGDDPITLTGAVIGTPRYLAPEQATGQRDVGPRADVYQAGVLIHEMLSGRTPIDADDPIRLLAAIAEDRRERLRAACPSAPLWLARIVERATEIDPQKRFADGEALARALAEHLALDEATSRELGLREKETRSRARAGAGLAAAIGLVMGAVFAMVASPSVSDSPSHSRSLSPSRSSSVSLSPSTSPSPSVSLSSSSSPSSSLSASATPSPVSTLAPAPPRFAPRARPMTTSPDASPPEGVVLRPEPHAGVLTADDF